jgi:hypothetical protein
MKRFALDHPWQLALGLGVWAAWFVVMYAGVTVACAVAPPDPQRGAFNWVNAVLLLVTLATTLWLAWSARTCARMAQRLKASSATSTSTDDEAGVDEGLRRFVVRAAALLYAVAAVSTVFVGLPLLALRPCL